MPQVTINGEEIEVEKGTTILQAAAQLGYDIPHFCYHPALSIPANCRMCLVEVEGEADLQPSCHSPVNDGMVVHTESDRVVKARKSVLEFILVNHPVDCPICDQAGECKLQDYYMAYDAQESRLRTEKTNKVKVYPLGPEVVYDGERCILCTRCVRFCEEITETNELQTVQRGDNTEIRTFPGEELDNNYSMCTVDICPVGALTARDFRFKCRVWLLSSTDSICTGCSKGCNVHLDHFQNEIQRYRPRYNPDVNDYWMCDPGRYTYKEVHDDRLYQPHVDGSEVKWYHAQNALEEEFADRDGDSTAFVVSPQATCEGLYLAKEFAEEGLETEHLYMGGKPDGMEDDLLIEADKNPNRRGAEYVWGGLDAIADFEQLITDLESGEIDALYMMNKHVPTEDEALRERFFTALEGLDVFVLQSMHRGDFEDLDGELVDRADVAFPACTHAEQDGTFVNVDGLAQAVDKAFEPHGSSLPDWQIFVKLADAVDASISYGVLREIREAMFGDADEAPESLEAQEGASRSPIDASTQPSEPSAAE